MELSICIPVYNTQVLSLVRELISQAKSLNRAYEIVVLDDASRQEAKTANAALKEMENVVYQELPENIGRAAIRNKLAQKARARLLLFLDDDSMPASKDFLKNYISQKLEGVCCGGRQYPDKDPGPQYRLHYTYGRFRESRTADQRAVKPYHSFHSNNFVIKKEVMLSTPFDESLRKYGHEDSFFAYQLMQKQVPLKHIDNPVLHTQLETNKEFLMKTRQGLENLHLLQQRENFSDFIKLLKTAKRLAKRGLAPLMKGIYLRNRKKWEHHLLTSEKPSMRIFNLYKLGYFLSL